MSYKKPIFEGVPKKQVNKSTFNLSHEWKCNYVPGYLQPVMLMETLPGDEWKINSEFLFRFAPMYFPIMHKMTMRCNYFYIPNRILWPYQGPDNPGWEKWIAELSEVEHPNLDVFMAIDTSSGGDRFNYTLASKFGIPELEAAAPYTNLVTDINVNAFPFSAYLKIWDYYYRIPQLEDERWFPLDFGNNTTAFETSFGATTGAGLVMFSSKWEQDYFTAALPLPQVGDGITIPISEEATTVRRVDGSSFGAGDSNLQVSSTGTPEGTLQTQGTTSDVIVDNAGTIRDLRLAETLQHYFERIMKVGQRYRDFIKGLWGNDPQPGLIDQPVMIGAKFGRVQISDVMTQANTIYSASSQTRTGDYTGQANLYSGGGEMLYHYCEEHGWIMALLELNPNTSYGQGVHRYWKKAVQTDYALDLFAGIGDQEITKEELWHFWGTSTQTANEETWGYIPRFSEYRFFNNIHVAELNRGSGLSQHLGRVIDGGQAGSNPEDVVLSDQFTNVIQDGNTTGDLNNEWRIRNVDVFRTFPLNTTPSGTQTPAEGIVYCHIYHEIYVDRNLPFFSTPKLG